MRMRHTHALTPMDLMQPRRARRHAPNALTARDPDRLAQGPRPFFLSLLAVPPRVRVCCAPRLREHTLLYCWPGARGSRFDGITPPRRQRELENERGILENLNQALTAKLEVSGPTKQADLTKQASSQQRLEVSGKDLTEQASSQQRLAPQTPDTNRRLSRDESGSGRPAGQPGSGVKTETPVSAGLSSATWSPAEEHESPGDTSVTRELASSLHRERPDGLLLSSDSEISHVSEVSLPDAY